MNIYSELSFNFYIIVSTEDHQELIKGGIGTYLGLLKKAFLQFLPKVQLIWLTESPNNKFFVHKEKNCRIFYLPKSHGNIKDKIEKNCFRIYKTISCNKSNRLIIEAPDWEGLLSNLYQRNLEKNTLKITRLHSI